MLLWFWDLGVFFFFASNKNGCCAETSWVCNQKKRVVILRFGLRMLSSDLGCKCCDEIWGCWKCCDEIWVASVVIPTWCFCEFCFLMLRQSLIQSLLCNCEVKRGRQRDSWEPEERRRRRRKECGGRVGESGRKEQWHGVSLHHHTRLCPIVAWHLAPLWIPVTPIFLVAFWQQFQPHFFGFGIFIDKSIILRPYLIIVEFILSAWRWVRLCWVVAAVVVVVDHQVSPDFTFWFSGFLFWCFGFSWYGFLVALLQPQRKLVRDLIGLWGFHHWKPPSPKQGKHSGTQIFQVGSKAPNFLVQKFEAANATTGMLLHKECGSSSSTT